MCAGVYAHRKGNWVYKHMCTQRREVARCVHKGRSEQILWAQVFIMCTNGGEGAALCTCRCAPMRDEGGRVDTWRKVQVCAHTSVCVLQEKDRLYKWLCFGEWMCLYVCKEGRLPVSVQVRGRYDVCRCRAEPCPPVLSCPCWTCSLHTNAWLVPR